jgi:hypothetical protein
MAQESQETGHSRRCQGSKASPASGEVAKFGARASIPNYEAAAKSLMEQGGPPALRRLVVMTGGGGVEKRDEHLVTALLYATAREFWLEEGMVAEQVAAVRVAIGPDSTGGNFWMVAEH